MSLSSLVLSVAQKAAVGDVAIQSVRLESTLDGMIAHLANLNEHEFAVLIGAKMIDAKLGIVERLGVKKLRSKKRITEFERLIETLKGLNTERNAVIHGAWQPKGGFKLNMLISLMPYGSSDEAEAIHSRPNRAIKKLSSKRLMELPQALDSAQSTLWQFWMYVWVKPAAHRAVRRKNRPTTI